MTYFLACFGFSKKRKRRKPPSKNPYGEQVHGSYEPLDSNVIIKLDSREKPISPDSELIDKHREKSSRRTKKKVSFNLNVKTYEPISKDEETAWEDNEEETEKAGISMERMGSYPSNYRYRNWRDGYDEDDDIELEESDLDGNDSYDSDEEDNHGSNNLKQVEFSKHFDSLSMELEKRVSLAQLAQNKTRTTMHHCASLDEELKKPESNSHARDRSRYVHSVLNPVENITQWKAVKATETPPLKQRKKENVAFDQEQKITLSSMPSFNLFHCNSLPNLHHSKPLMPNIAVDVSLSNWLVPSEIEAIAKSGTTADASMSSNKNMFNRSNSSVEKIYRL
ncbi:unnamed protein product [Ilex paraguariensis]|uniref:Uncharacterized protein n=1 Tax=Ilex paraguariensis TaxID=185542 RepID=A0ABC8R3F6_9AQUA